MRLARRLSLALFLTSGLTARAAAQHAPNPGTAATVVIVVRHAEKDTIPKDDPGLTTAGVIRANALAEALAHANIQAVITTQLIRTRETARSIAKARGLTPETVVRGTDIAQHARAVAAAVRRHRGQTVLVVGHGETVGPIIAALGGPAVPDLCADQYSSLFTLVLDDDNSQARFIRSSYGAPSPAPDTTLSCGKK